MLSLYGIPTVETRTAADEDEAATMAAELGFPVVLKILSATITHKTDVGGAKLNLHDEAAVRAAFATSSLPWPKKLAPSSSPGVTVQPM